MPLPRREYYVYILSSRTRALYVGVTNDLTRRLQEHRDGVASEFTRRYQINRLVYVEATPDVAAAIAREKQIRDGSAPGRRPSSSR